MVSTLETQLLTLHIDAPFLWIETKRFQCTLLAESLRFIDVLIASIVSCTRVAFRVLVCPFVSALSRVVWLWCLVTLHHTSQSVEYCLRGEVLGRYEVYEVFLPSFLLRGVSGGGTMSSGARCTFSTMSKTVGSAV